MSGRFFINHRGLLVDRESPTRYTRRTGFSMEANRASRTEMQILADMLNEPAQAAAYDAGDDPTWAWAQRIAEVERGIRAWNAMSEAQRAAALRAANTACPADAMRRFGFKAPEIRHVA